MGAVPTINTERLTLRRHVLDDFDDCAAMWADPKVTRHIGSGPCSVEEVWTRLLRYVGHWSLLGFGFWAVEATASGRFVGEVGLADFKRDIEPSFDGAAEAGWVLAAWAHGKGFATEAVVAALAWYDARFGPARTVCMIREGNVASVRVAEKCGYREFHRATYKGQPTTLFERCAGFVKPGEEAAWKK